MCIIDSLMEIERKLRLCREKFLNDHNPSQQQCRRQICQVTRCIRIRQSYSNDAYASSRNWRCYGYSQAIRESTAEACCTEGSCRKS
ncbi:hypothetical protein F0562_018760 [Nyssa sinensis]|nr:hypothetical protein F0562_018760 [Nyssa sinensis]